VGGVQHGESDGAVVCLVEEPRFAADADGPRGGRGQQDVGPQMADVPGDVAAQGEAVLDDTVAAVQDAGVVDADDRRTGQLLLLPQHRRFRGGMPASPSVTMT
jgi:hypothetical protein